MSYKLIFDKKAIEFLESLPREIRQRIFERISAAKENPMHFLSGWKDGGITSCEQVTTG